MTPYPDNFAYVILVEDAIGHTSDHPFCWDQTCGCHEDPVLLEQVAQAVSEGCMTPDEATRLVKGEQL